MKIRESQVARTIGDIARALYKADTSGSIVTCFEAIGEEGRRPYLHLAKIAFAAVQKESV